MQRICLAMIAKNEAHVIERALSSVRPYISAWVVCDTGSTDDTAQRVQDALAGIPGQLHLDPWVDFGHNRSLSVARARDYNCAYILVLDADEVLCVDDPVGLEDLTAACYFLRSQMGAYSFLQDRLLRADLPWRYVGKIHESPDCGVVVMPALLSGVSLSTAQDGARSHDPNKLERDIATLQLALAEQPENGRLWFHLGLTLRAASRLQDAIDAFKHCYDESEANSLERWYARYQLGTLYVQTNQWWMVPEAFLKSYAQFPATAEPLYWLGRFHLGRSEPEEALPYLELAATKAKPEGLFIREDSIYEWEARVWLARCLVCLERPADANAVLLTLIRTGSLPGGVLAPDTEAHLMALAAVGA